LGKPFGAGRVDKKDTGPVVETAKRYESVAQYDAVLRSHCCLDRAQRPPEWRLVRSQGGFEEKEETGVDAVRRA